MPDRRIIAAFIALNCLAFAPLPAQQPITLNQALNEARRANARLPVAATDLRVVRAQLDETRGRFWPRLLADGDLHAGTPQKYATSDARLQLIALDTLYDGGRLRTNQSVVRQQLAAAGAGYRMLEKDVELEVRLAFYDAARAQTEIATRQQGLARLETYRHLVEARRAAGQGVSADLLRVNGRIGSERAELAAATSRLVEAKLELNQLMGRVPDTTLELAPLPVPQPPDSVASRQSPWLRTPEVEAATAGAAIARSGVDLVRAERRPTFALEGNIGVTPVLGDRTAPALLNTGRGAGAEVVLSVTLPLWDKGVYHARLEQAQLARQAAEDSLTIAQQQTRLAWMRAEAQLEGIYRELQIRHQNVDLARDAYLEAESLYRGGGGSSLEVLDAYSDWSDALLAEADTLLAYRQAEAQLEKWGTP
ncbi:MAG TPA: TolC family protein [Gemmatimonadales bacterium]|nr:TolC family protein [Gemmatimonadales bacterium]